MSEPTIPGQITVDGSVQAANVAADEASGTPPKISAQTRTTVYLVCLIFNVIAVLTLGILPILGVITLSQAFSIGGIIFIAINLISSGLAVGYRPTRPGSPIAS